MNRSENLAAIVNGLLVLLVPLAIAVVGSSFDFDSDTSTTVHASGGARIAAAIQGLAQIGAVAVPFAMVAGWRTWVHAKRRRDRHERGWQGVAEAGACGLITALVILSPGILLHPIQAVPYVIAYGGAASILGLLIGLILRTTAIIVLTLSRSQVP